MDMRLEHTAIQAEIPSAVCRSQIVAEGEVTLPGSLRETTCVLHAAAMAVVESAEAGQDRASFTGRVIFSVLYTQGNNAKADAIEATADFTHLCDMPGAVPRAEISAYAQVEQVDAAVQNGRMTMRAVVRLCARALASESAEPIARIDDASAQQRMTRLTLRRTAGRGGGDVLLREEFSLPEDLVVRDTLAAWASVRMNDATGGQGRIGLNGEVTLEAIHASDLPGKPLVMTRHTIPVNESVELKGDSGEILDGRMVVKDVAVASQDMGDGERTLRCEVLLGLSAWAEREEAFDILSDAYTTDGDDLRLGLGLRVAHEFRDAQLVQEVVVDAAVGAPRRSRVLRASGTGALALLGHAALEALAVNLDAALGANFRRDLNREAVGVMQGEGLFARQHGTLKLLEGLFQEALALAQRGAEALLLGQDELALELAVLDDLGVHMAHEAHNLVDVLVEERALDADEMRLHNGAAQQAAQHVAAALVGRQDAVGDHEGHRAAVVGNDTQR